MQMKNPSHVSPSASLPVRRDLTLAYVLSLVAALMIAASVAGLVLGSAGLYGADPKTALGVREAEAGLLVPGLLGQDAFNLVVGLPILLGSMWLARRGSLAGLLLWPGALFYALYAYAIYLLGAPFTGLVFAYVALVILYASTLMKQTLDKGGDDERAGRLRFAVRQHRAHRPDYRRRVARIRRGTNRPRRFGTSCRAAGRGPTRRGVSDTGVATNPRHTVLPRRNLIRRASRS